MRARLVGVGVGPGDPELLTLKALRALQEAEVVYVPVTSPGDPGRAEAIVAEHAPGRPIERLPFTVAGDPSTRARAWERAAERLAGRVARTGTVAFATVGDPALYSTFGHLADAVRRRVPGVCVERIPGITAMQALAARSGVALATGDEPLTLLPLTGGLAGVRDAIAREGTVVAYKAGRSLPEVLGLLRETGRLPGAVYGAEVGRPDERVLPAAELTGSERGPYFSTLLIPARRKETG